ncbi:uncharacterized protein [Typha angustifolia]|uniref:uncharacterized protein isoform X2 n=1 Tax=Typha angustifolia TaxID=59011 RepID=UPI003C2F0ECB
MADKVSTLILKVDLDCKCCYKKIEKILCKIQDEVYITRISYDEKNNTVTVSGPFDPDKLSKKLRCKAGKLIIDITRLPPKTTAEDAMKVAEEGKKAAAEAKKEAAEAKKTAEDAKRTAEDAKRTAEDAKRTAEDAKKTAEEVKKLPQQVDVNVKVICEPPAKPPVTFCCCNTPPSCGGHHGHGRWGSCSCGQRAPPPIPSYRTPGYYGLPCLQYIFEDK